MFIGGIYTCAILNADLFLSIVESNGYRVSRNSSVTR